MRVVHIELALIELEGADAAGVDHLIAMACVACNVHAT
jgi:hypothetical protein